jgi:hypothetical protein
MKVIFGKKHADELSDRMTILELDTFFQAGLDEPVTAYAVIDTESVPIHEFPVLENHIELHNTMMAEYRKQNWDYVEQALEHLPGRWGGTLDSFYEELSKRVTSLKDQSLPGNWTGVIINTPAQ